MHRIFIRLSGWYLALASLASLGFLTFSLVGIGVLSISAIVVLEGALTYFAPQILVTFWTVRPCPDEILNALKPLAASLGIRDIRVYLLPSSSINAIPVGLGRNKAILLTSRILECYPADETSAILAHEMGHVARHDLSLYAGIMVAITVFAPLPGLLWAGGLVSRVMAAVVVPPLVLILPLLAVSRSRERAADRFCLRALSDPEIFIRALRRTETLINKRPATRELDGSVLATTLSPHPTFSDRVRRAREYHGV